MAIMNIASIVIGSSGDFIVSTGKAALISFDTPAEISITSLELTPNVVRNNSVTLDITELSLEANSIIIKTSTRKVFKKTKIPRRAWQARLGSKMDNIFVKTLDNTISLSSYPIDMVRVQVKKDERTHDVIARTIIASDVMPIHFENPLNELPLRRMEYNDSENIIMTVDGTKLEDIKVKCPISEILNRGDLLFRIIRDDYSERPIVLILQVKDELGTIGYSKVIQIDYILSYYDEKLPESVITAVIDSTEKREEVQW